jgi:hypothetical protein
MLWATPTQDQHLYSSVRAGDIRARARHKAGRRCWADPPELATTAESTEPAWEAERPAPGVVGRAQGLGIYQVIIAGAVAS